VTDREAAPTPAADREARRRWRLLLGQDPQDAGTASLSAEDLAMDAALGALYDNASDGEPGSKENLVVGMGSSAPRVARWLGDIRSYFPATVVQVMQADAMDRLGLKRLLFEPEMMAAVTPDVHLVSTLVQLKNLMPERAKSTARQVVATVVTDLERRIADRTNQAVRGALNRAARTRRPPLADVDWNRTIRANLRHYLADHKTVIPERLVGYGRKHTGFQREIVLCVDQSGSMASSVVYASVFACVLASIRSIRTQLVVYDTAVVDLTDHLADPVDVIFGTQLGGGNDTPRALAYVAERITRPRDTVVVLISDLYEGAGSDLMNRRLEQLKEAGSQVVVLLALDDDGTPSYDKENASVLAGAGIPVFACTPDAFPEVMALAITHGDIGAWAASRAAAKGTG
jgi:Mg-chelatase subunit ChlD